MNRQCAVKFPRKPRTSKTSLKSSQTKQVQVVAKQLAEAQTALSELPVHQQYVAVSLAEKLRNISDNLAAAAQYGAQTAHRLSALANSEVAKVDDAEPLASVENLKGVAALTKLANESATIALNLLSSNKETVQRINDGTDGSHIPTSIELVTPHARTD